MQTFDLCAAQGGPSHLSPAAAGGGIGRGGTPVVGALQQGEAATASPAPFTGYGTAPSSQVPPPRPANTATGVQMTALYKTQEYCFLLV